MFNVNDVSDENKENNEKENKLIANYLDHLRKVFNIEQLKGTEDEIDEAKKVISCFTDPRSKWFVRTKSGLCESARVTENELDAIIKRNKSTFMITENGKITLRIKILNLSPAAIIHFYKLDEI